MGVKIYNSRFTADITYPLAALAGQERLKLALILLAVDPGLGGVLLVGEKGTAKSTAVRGLVDLLPPLTAVEGCAYHCDPERPADLCPDCQARLEAGESLPKETVSTPFLTLPLGATEDRVAGGLDLELSIRTGRAHLRPGLLGQTNRGFLYVDEVNLLEPYLAHILLDAVESGRLWVEREGISSWHPAQVALIGTMNPEEGALGPQLSDRFALTVRVSAEADPTIRTEIVRRRMAFEKDPAEFRRLWADEIRSLAESIIEARERLAETILTPDAWRLITALVQDNESPGHRGDLALARASTAFAAFQGFSRVLIHHVLDVADLALDYRRAGDKKSTAGVKTAKIIAPNPAQLSEKPYVPPTRKAQNIYEIQPGDGPEGRVVNRLYTPNEIFDITTPVSRREQGPKGRSGRRASRRTVQAKGRYFRSSSERLGRPVALDATLRAAAPHQKTRLDQAFVDMPADDAPRDGGMNKTALIIRNHDIREKVYRHKTGRLIMFVVDASGSVGSFDRMSEAKAAVLSLLREAYQKRDRVGLIAFHGAKAKVLLPPTNSVELASRLLEDLPTGGKTPLAAALISTHYLVRMELSRDPDLTPLVILMTDGRPNVPLTTGADPWPEALDLAQRLAQDRRLRFLLVDTDNGHYSEYKMTHELAEALRAPRLSLEDIRTGRMDAWIKQVA